LFSATPLILPDRTLAVMGKAEGHFNILPIPGAKLLPAKNPK